MRKFWVGLGAVATAAMFLVGCKHKVGQKCSPGKEYCSPEGALFCGEDGTLKLMPCHGPKGCKATAGKVSCDTSTVVVGEGCNTPEDYFECTTDKKAVAVCKSEKWVNEATCKGVKGCRSSSDGISCDSTTADTGDECHTNGNYACTPAKDQLLQCTDNAFAILSSCRGPAGCSSREDIAAKTTNFRCDSSLAQEGDVCEIANDYTCAVDKKAVLVCQSGKWAVHKPCAGACSIDASNNVSCNGVVAGHGGGANHSAPVAPTKPTPKPSGTPTPTAKPSVAPSATTKPSATPSAAPSTKPSATPSAAPSTKPSAAPTTKPSAAPTTKPTTAPTAPKK